jgi:hypothetical protein
VRRYLEEAGVDPDRARGLLAMHGWLTGRRDLVRMEPEGVAPPGRRYSATRR